MVLTTQKRPLLVGLVLFLLLTLVNSLAWEFSREDKKLGFAMADLYDDDDFDDDSDDFFDFQRGSGRKRKQPKQCRTIIDVICDDEDFTLLCAALEQAGLTNALDNKNRIWTLFAPTDEAFLSLDREIAEAVFESVENLEFVLLYHAVRNQEIFSRQLQCRATVTMTNMKDTRTLCKGQKVFQKGGGNSDDQLPEIIDADIEACNGVIHVIDQVMLPTRLPDEHYGKRPTQQPVARPSRSPTPPSPYPTPYYPKPQPRSTPYPTPYPTQKRKDTPYPTSFPTYRPTYRPTPYPPPPVPETSYPEPEPYYPDPYDPGPDYHYPEENHEDAYYPEEDHDEDDYHDDYYHDDQNEDHHDEDDYYNDDHHEDQHDDYYHDDDDDDDDDSKPEGRGGDFVCLSIGDLICQTGGLELLCEVFSITGLAPFLQNEFQWTLFAPTNEAIENLIQSVPTGTLNTNNMADLLGFHMIENNVIEFSDLPCEQWVQMSDGGYTYTHCRGFEKFQVGRGNGFQDNIIMLRDSPIILREDIGACNGIIHTVDAVLLPSWWQA